jgi:ribonucleoside-triphosphate reductase
MSVEHRFVTQLPKIKKHITITHRPTKDADFIVPDSREGWNELTRRVLESFFVTGKSFTYSTICVRGYGEPISRFGGVAAGPQPLIRFVENICSILIPRQGRHVRPIDAADIICAVGEMVVSGNVRRSAIIILGDAWDKEYLRAKRWDLGLLPSYRSNANFSVVCEDTEDLHPLFWKTYEIGEPFGIINRRNIQRFGRMGEPKKDTAEGVNPCAEATLENGEPCNLQEINLMNIQDEEEFVLAARLMHRYGKRVTCEDYHHQLCNSVVKRNRRVGTGITGCLGSNLFRAESLDRAYQAIAQENSSYSRELGIPESIRTTVVKPSGTLSKVFDCRGYEGIHPAFSRYMIQRVRFASNDKLIPLLREAGHHIEPEQKLDGTINHGTLVVDFYQAAPEGFPVADEGWDLTHQLNTVKFAQRWWADQSVSVTVYYKKSEIGFVKEWLRENLSNIKTISFLCHNDHGYNQAPKSSLTKEQYEKAMAKLKPIAFDRIEEGNLESQECAGGSCPVR